MKFTHSFFPALIWGIFVFVVVLIPGNFIPHVRTFSQWLQWDKMVHLVLFGILGLFLLRGFSKRRSSVIFKRDYLITCVICVIYGGFTEYLQYSLSIGRDGNVYDFCANTVGTVLGCLLFFFLSVNKKTEANRQEESERDLQ
jgi:VanZ family protein